MRGGIKFRCTPPGKEKMLIAGNSMFKKDLKVVELWAIHTGVTPYFLIYY